MSPTCRTWLVLAAALAAGEGVAARLDAGGAAWPVLLGAAVLVALLGYGRAVRGWLPVSVALLGASLLLHDADVAERARRATPWLRGAVCGRQPKSAFPSVRRELSRRVGLGLDHAPEVAALNRAILLGDRRRMPRELKRRFADAGALHVFAISGLHVMVVARLLMILSAVLLVPVRAQGLAVLPLVWGYVAVIGFPPSAVRAALMATLQFGAPLFWRRSDGLVAWAVTFVAVHLVSPGQIANLGSQFSFVVMLALVLAERSVRDLPAGWVRRLFVPFVIWAAGVPLAAAAFGRVTPGGLVSNAVLVAAATQSVAAGALGVLTSFVWEPLAVHANNLAAIVTEAMTGFAGVVARLPGSSFEVPPWGFLECAEWYLALLLVLLLADRRARRRAVL